MRLGVMHSRHCTLLHSSQHVRIIWDCGPPLRCHIFLYLLNTLGFAVQIKNLPMLEKHYSCISAIYQIHFKSFRQRAYNLGSP